MFPGTDTPRSRTSWESTVHDIQGRRGRAGRVFDDPSFFFFSFFFLRRVESYRLSFIGGWLLERAMLRDAGLGSDLNLDLDFSREIIYKELFRRNKWAKRNDWIK